MTSDISKTVIPHLNRSKVRKGRCPIGWLALDIIGRYINITYKL